MYLKFYVKNYTIGWVNWLLTGYFYHSNLWKSQKRRKS